jgi:hypothetical protein
MTAKRQRRVFANSTIERRAIGLFGGIVSKDILQLLGEFIYTMQSRSLFFVEVS